MVQNSLTLEEVRVIGSLIEKEKTTPEYYPMSVNALMNACNQKSNRFPVVSYNEELVMKTIESLREKKFVVKRTGDDIRVPKYRQSFTEFYNLTEPEIAVMCVLFLRGAQTLGEIKTHCSRIHSFENLEALDLVLNQLMSREEPFIQKQPRQTGMKESRYIHLFSLNTDTNENNSDAEAKDIGDNSSRIEMLETRVQNLEDELKELKSMIDSLLK
ncbi:MAG: YceH family protein [Ignavibacteriales bacterium]|nr:MAG: YceH family protein [Ignavibacteriales bacterium]